ncbi:MAG: dipeptidase, partial [Bryobacteraceae bacterium]
HNDVTSETVRGLDIGPRRQTGHTDLARLRDGGVGAVFFAAYVAGSYTNGNRSANRALEMIDTIRHDIAGRYPNDFVLALTAGDIEAAHRKGRIAALVGIEGGHAIEDSLRLLRDFHALGVRYMTLTHSNTNNWADSSGDITRGGVKHHNGLTSFGRDVVREMNRLGMMVDISHVADETFWDAMEASLAPPFASHSSCRAISNIPRNMTDEMIVALAKKGGVVQINFGCEFLSQKSADTSTFSNPKLRELRVKLDREIQDPAARREQFRKLREVMGLKSVPASLADAVAHIDHVVKIAGIDAAGIGSDYDGVSCTPVGLEDVSKFPNLTRALLEKGYTAEQIRKIYGGNILRVMRASEKVAREHVARR